MRINYAVLTSFSVGRLHLLASTILIVLTLLAISAVQPTAKAHHGSGHSPGGVSSNLSLWLKADEGITGTSIVTQWDDQSGNGYNLDQSEGDPNAVSDLENFNPTIAFDGSGDALGRNDGIGVSSTEDATYFLVTTKNAGNGAIVEFYPTGTFASPLASNNFTFLYTNDANPLFNNLQSTQIGDTGNGNVDIFTDPNTPVAGSPNIFSFRKDNTANLSSVSINALPPAANEANTYDIDPAVTIVGRNKNYDIDLDGTISEIVVYDTNLADTDIQYVQSYLAVKYGIDLDNSTDYVDSSGNTIWSIGTNSSFPNNTFGIGRDDNTTLDQRISSSQNTGTILTVALDPDFTSPNNDSGRTSAFSNNLEFVLFSDNAGTTTASTAELPLSGVYKDRVEREWKPTLSGGFSDTLNFKFDGMGGDDWRLIHSTSGNLASGGAVISDLGPLDTNGEIANVTLPTGGVLTLARIAEAPGGVNANLSLWLKANAGTSTSTNGAAVAAWTDQSSVGNDATSDITPNPFFSEAGGNFNPSITYSPSVGIANRESLVLDPSLLPTGTSSRSIVLVLNPDDNHYNTNTTYFGAFNYGDWAGGGGDFIGLDASASGLRIGYAGYAETSPVSSSDQHMITLTLGENVNTDEGLYYFNGGSQVLTSNGNGSVQLVNTGTDGANIGAVDGGGTYVGDISELIVYEEDLSAADLQQVHSYLALKYGITLDQSTAAAYLASDGTTKMWDETVDASFNNDIAGIGRDDIQQLDQRISKSVNSDSLVALALDDNFTSTNSAAARITTHAADKSFLSWANNNASIAAWSDTGAPSGRVILPRIWQAQETGTVGTIHISVPDDSSSLTTTLPAENTTVYLLTDSDTDFSSGAAEIALTLNGDNWELPAGVDLSDGQYFTFASLDITKPDVAINQSSSQSDPSNSSPVKFTVVFSESINESTFTASDIDTSTSTATGVSITSITEIAPNDDTTFEVSIGATMDGVITATLPAGTVEDVAGNTSTVSTSIDNSTTLDMTSPVAPTVNSPTPTGPAELFPNIDINIECEVTGYILTIYSSNITPNPTTHVCSSIGPVDVPVVLTEGGTVSLTVTATDSTGDESAATPVLFNAGSASDTDGDGISDDEESAGLNGGDGNGDGIPDFQQTFISSKVSPVSNDPVTLESNGSDCQLIDGYEIIAESDNAENDNSYNYPIGLHDYTLRCLSAGATANVTFYFDRVYDTSEWTWRKFDRNGKVYASMQDRVTYSTTTVGSKEITTASYSITDGGPLDEDGIANGIIVDPSGPAVEVEGLSETGRGMLNTIILGLHVMIVPLLLLRPRLINHEER